SARSEPTVQIDLSIEPAHHPYEGGPQLLLRIARRSLAKESLGGHPAHFICLGYLLGALDDLDSRCTAGMSIDDPVIAYHLPAPRHAGVLGDWQQPADDRTARDLLPRPFQEAGGQIPEQRGEGLLPFLGSLLH